MLNSNVNDPCTTIEQCKKIAQYALVELDNKTKENAQLKKDKEEITGERNQLQKDRDDWKNLYLDERKASNLLAQSNLKQQEAITTFQAQVKSDTDMINSQKRKIRLLKVEKYVYSAGSFGIGFAAGYYSRDVTPTVNGLLAQNRNSGFRLVF